jgi:hypothetical protein
MPENADNPLSFWQELKRRKVIRVIAVYAAAAFVILELVDINCQSAGILFKP